MIAEISYKNKSKKVELPQDWGGALPLFANRSLRIYWAKFILMGDMISAHVVYVSRLLRGLYGSASAIDVDTLVSAMPWMARTIEKLDIPIYPIYKALHIPMVMRCAWCKDMGQNITLREFIYLDEYLDKYAQEDGMAIYELLATLCRPVDKDILEGWCRDDVRIPLRSRDEVAVRAKVIAEYDKCYYMHADIQMCLAAALLMTIKIKQVANDLFIRHLRSGASNDDENNAGGGINFGWHTVAQDVAESGAFGTLDQVYDSPFYDLGMYLLKKKSEADRMRRDV